PHLGSLTPAGGPLFFAADDGTHGSELWATDGTTSGTALVKDIAPGADSGLNASLSLPYPYGSVTIPPMTTEVNGRVVFTAVDPDSSGYFALWASDGTESGTVPLTSAALGYSDEIPSGMTNVGGTVYFQNFTTATGRELWQTDGPAAG